MNSDELLREHQALRERLSRLSRALRDLEELIEERETSLPPEPALRARHRGPGTQRGAAWSSGGACSRGRATLADGSDIAYDVHGVAGLWDGRLRYIEADAAHTTPPVGSKLLHRHSLNIKVKTGSRIVIQARGQPLLPNAASGCCTPGREREAEPMGARRHAG